MKQQCIQTDGGRLGTPVDLRSYSSWSNQYVAPCDGYVWLFSNISKESVFISNSSNPSEGYISLTASTDQHNSIYVKKGLHINTPDQLNQNSSLNFVPLT